MSAIASLLVTHVPNVAKTANQVFRMQDGVIKDTVTNHTARDAVNEEHQLLTKLEQTQNEAVQTYSQELKKINKQIADIRAVLDFSVAS